jgi:hypothetical protein
MLFDAPEEREVARVGGESHGGDRTAAVVDRDGEPAADAKFGRLVEELLLSLREFFRPNPESPLERLRALPCLHDHGVQPFVVTIEIVVSPGERIGGYQLSLAAE